MKNNYSIGFPAGNYDTLLNSMSKTSVHSSKTSSIPLAEFWHPRNSALQKKLLHVVGMNDFDEADKIFEYATPAYQKGYSGPTIQYSGPSMTDLMIIGSKHKITIEAKYTEYKKDAQPYHPSIGKWIDEHAANNNLLPILNCWRQYIGIPRYNNIEEAKSDKDFPYQFLHRAASACFNSQDKERVLLYQLFYDSQTKDNLHEFESNLCMWAKQLELQNNGVRFIIAEIKVDEDKSPAIKSKKKAELFLDMIASEQYKFLDIKCLDGYTLTEI